jgi:hypothetical protein
MVNGIARIFADELENAVNKGGKEPQIVERFANAVDARLFPPSAECGQSSFTKSRTYFSPLLKQYVVK